VALLPRQYLTPKFDADDPIIGREMYLRPSLWAVFFGHMDSLTYPWNWRQSEDPTGASIDEVVAEIKQALLSVEFTHMYIGELRPFALADPPEGWLRCDGATYANTDYPLLAEVIHPGYVVDADNFRVPDGNRRIFVDGIYPGMQEGSETHTNTIEELVPHTHTVIDPGAILVLPGTGPEFALTYPGAPTDTGSTGDGEEYSILNPVEGTQWYIRAAWPTAGG